MQRKIVVVRGLSIGEGRPKLCVPMMGATVEELRREAKALKKAGTQMAEWRMDWFEGIREKEKTITALSELRKELGNLPLLATLRTKKEGGNIDIEPEDYRRLYETILAEKQADIIDLELFFHRETVKELLASARSCGVKTVVSSHDFQKTPKAEEMKNRLIFMEQMGCDIAKLAVMPQSAEDVAELLKATAQSAKTLSCPIVTMSMGKKGIISRMAGEIFGSAITFACVNKASAPGQLPLFQLREILEWIGEAQ